MFPHPPFILPSLLLLFSSLSYAQAALQNFTVDDTLGDPSGFSLFSLIPVNGEFWNNGPNCTGCGFRPDINECVDETYHGATVGVNGSGRGYNLTFYGEPLSSVSLSSPAFPNDPFLSA